jgi:hypothetical protein
LTAAKKPGVPVVGLLLGVLSVTICAGMAAALGISNLIQKGLFANWESLGVPTASANQIKGGSLALVAVQDQGGTIYQLNFQYGDQDQTWTQVGNVDSRLRESCLPLESTDQKQAFSEKYSLLSEPPGMIVDHCFVPYMLPESLGVVVYALTKQGEVLRWQSPDAFYALGQALKWGLLGGIGLGLALAGVLILRRNLRKQG